MYRSIIAVSCLMFLAFSITGCSNDGIGYVEGKVTVDGQPAPAGLRINFTPVEPGQRESTAETDKNGYYNADFSIQRKGVYIGECVARLMTPEDGLPEEGEELNLRYPDEYYVEIKKFTVKAGKNKVDLEITSKKK